MELHLTVEQEEHLAEIAQDHGVTADVLVTEITRGLIEEDDRERETIRQRIHRADQRIFIEEQEMDARIKAMLHPR